MTLSVPSTLVEVASCPGALNLSVNKTAFPSEEPSGTPGHRQGLSLSLCKTQAEPLHNNIPPEPCRGASNNSYKLKMGTSPSFNMNPSIQSDFIIKYEQFTCAWEGNFIFQLPIRKTLDKCILLPNPNDNPFKEAVSRHQKSNQKILCLDPLVF